MNSTSRGSRLVTSAAGPCGFNKYREVRARLFLADEFRQPLRTQANIRVIGAGLWRHEAARGGHFASSLKPCRISVATSAASPALRVAAAMAAAACGWP